LATTEASPIVGRCCRSLVGAVAVLVVGWGSAVPMAVARIWWSFVATVPVVVAVAVVATVAVAVVLVAAAAADAIVMDPMRSGPNTSST
jgi:hypothetical protein